MLFCCSVVSDFFAIPWTAAHQAPLSVGFPSKNTRVGCHFFLLGIFSDQESNPSLLHWQADSLLMSHQGSPLFSFYSPFIQSISPSSILLFFHINVVFTSIPLPIEVTPNIQKPDSHYFKPQLKLSPFPYTTFYPQPSWLLFPFPSSSFVLFVALIIFSPTIYYSLCLLSIVHLTLLFYKLLQGRHLCLLFVCLFSPASPASRGNLPGE